MTREEFKAALGELNLPQTAPRTQALLGLGWRQIAYICAGRSPVPQPVERILGMLLLLQKMGHPPQLVQAALHLPIPLSRRRQAAERNRLDVVKGNILAAPEKKS